MHGVDSPADFAEYLRGELDGMTYWSDDVPRPDDVETHPQGQVYVDCEGETAETALYILRKVEDAGLRASVNGATIAIFPPKDTCGAGGCFADAKGSKPYRDLCRAHAAKAKHAKPAGVRAPEYYDE